MRKASDIELISADVTATYRAEERAKAERVEIEVKNDPERFPEFVVTDEGIFVDEHGEAARIAEVIHSVYDKGYQAGQRTGAMVVVDGLSLEPGAHEAILRALEVSHA